VYSVDEVGARFVLPFVGASAFKVLLAGECWYWLTPRR
jgi:hypothetical protein